MTAGSSARLPDDETIASQDIESRQHDSPKISMQHMGIRNNCKRAVDGLVRQAERMVKRSQVEHVPGNPGDNVTIPIPLVDRGRGDPRNIMGIIFDRDKNAHQIDANASKLD